MDLNYFGARYYDPVIGYWISFDPMEQFWSGYSYSANGFNPVNSVDPDGQAVQAIPIIAAGIMLTNAEALETIDGEFHAMLGVLTEGIGGIAASFGLSKLLKNDKILGVIYKRINPKTGEEYIGQAKSMERFMQRQKEHDKSLGIKHKYSVVGRAEPGVKLDVLEEKMIRQSGGLSKEGGTLANKRHQMSNERYKAAGGK